MTHDDDSGSDAEGRHDGGSADEENYEKRREAIPRGHLMPLAMHVSFQQPLRLTPGSRLFPTSQSYLATLPWHTLKNTLRLSTSHILLILHSYIKKIRGLLLRLPSANGTFERQSCESHHF